MAEILAPAGTFESMKAAANAGCDAVYGGGTMFGARAFAGNFDNEELLRAIDYMHLRGKRFYLTVNTLVKEAEIDSLCDYLRAPYEQGLDAVIVQDVGVLNVLHRNFKDLHIHASTQMTLTMAQSANMLKDYGAVRIVPARELCIDELARLRRDTALELEIFVHGALCYCYSGQCLMSSMIGGRSGNRGKCAQPCRKLYTTGKKSSYLLSPSDLCALESVPKLLEIGIDSFKIEGRMKGPEYAACVAAAYREASELCLELDAAGRLYEERRGDYAGGLSHEYLSKCAALKEKLAQLYNRGGFTGGYFDMHSSPKMMSMQRPNHCGVKVGEVVKSQKNSVNIKLEKDIAPGDILEIRQPDKQYEFTQKETKKAGEVFSANVYKGMGFAGKAQVYRTKSSLLLDEIQSRYIEKSARMKLRGSFFATKNRPVTLEISGGETGGISICVTGDVPQEAQNRQILPDEVRKQLEKLGETPYEFEQLEINLEDGLFIPIKALNELRREAVRKYEEMQIGSYRRKAGDAAMAKLDVQKSDSAKQLSAKVSTREQLGAVCECGAVDRVYISLEDFGMDMLDEAVRTVKQRGKKAYICLPHISRSKVYDYLNEHRETLKGEGVSGFIIRSFEELELVSSFTDDSFKPELILDYNMYVMNREAKAFWKDRYSKIKFTAPLELNAHELSALIDEQFELIVYGRAELMTSPQCVYKNSGMPCTKDSRKTDDKIIYITDETGHSMPIKRLCNMCTNVIYNSDCMELIGEEAARKIHCGSMRLDFTFENAKQTARTAAAYAEFFKGNGQDMKPLNEHYTRGYFKRSSK